jgi:hypothetical protein
MSKSGMGSHHLQPLLQRRILRLFQRRGLLEPATVENMLTWRLRRTSPGAAPDARLGAV